MVISTFKTHKENHLVLNKIRSSIKKQSKSERKQLSGTLGKNAGDGRKKKNLLRRLCDKHRHSGDLAGNERRRVVFPSAWCTFTVMVAGCVGKCGTVASNDLGKWQRVKGKAVSGKLLAGGRKETVRRNAATFFHLV